MPRPAISVLLCAHNRLSYLRQTLRSVDRQTFRDFEIVVVDDASTDGTYEWLARRRMPRLRLVRLERNVGPAAAQARGLAQARGRILALLDSDDIWYPRYLETVVAAFRSPRVAAVAANFDTIDARGRLLGRKQGPGRFHAGWLAVSGLEGLPMPSLFSVRRRALDEAGGIDQGFKWICNDIDLFLRLGLRFGPSALRWIDEPLGMFRRHAGLTSGLAAMDGRTFVKTLAQRCRRDPRQRELTLDWLYLRHKHGHWLRLVEEGASR